VLLEIAASAGKPAIETMLPCASRTKRIAAVTAMSAW
jgi:hypothetical protein